MTTPKRLDLQIHPFCNCDGCVKSVKRALGKLYDVKVLAMDPDIGKFTILTSNDPETIKHALKRVFPKRNINLAQEITSPSYPPMRRVTDVDDMARALLTMSQVKGVGSVEYTQTSTFKINFTNNGRNHPTVSSRLPPTLHDLQGSIGVHFEDTPPPSPPPCPPPRTYIRPSAPPMPTSPPSPLPLTYIRPSAPPVPTPPDLVYGYPIEFYGYDENRPRGCCNIL